VGIGTPKTLSSFFPRIRAAYKLYSAALCPPPPAAAPRRVQADPGHLRPSCGRESTSRASLSLLPHSGATPEPLAAEIGAADAPILFLYSGREGGGRREGFLPKSPSSSLYFLKKPPTFGPFCKRDLA